MLPIKRSIHNIAIKHQDVDSQLPNTPVIFSRITGAVVAAYIAPFDCSEIVMSRLLYDDLDPEDVLLAQTLPTEVIWIWRWCNLREPMPFNATHHARQTDFRARQKTGDWRPSSPLAQAQALSQAL